MVNLTEVYEISKRMGYIEYYDELIGPNMVKEDLDAVVTYLEEIRSTVDKLRVRNTIDSHTYNRLRPALSDAISVIRVNIHQRQRGKTRNHYPLYEMSMDDFSRFEEEWEEFLKDFEP